MTIKQSVSVISYRKRNVCLVPLSYLFDCNSNHFCQRLDHIWDRPAKIQHVLSVAVRSTEIRIKTINKYDKTRLKEMSDSRVIKRSVQAGHWYKQINITESLSESNMLCQSKVWSTSGSKITCTLPQWNRGLWNAVKSYVKSFLCLKWSSISLNLLMLVAA